MRRFVVFFTLISTLCIYKLAVVFFFQHFTMCLYLILNLLTVPLVISNQGVTPAHVNIEHRDEVIDRLLTPNPFTIESSSGHAIINPLEQVNHEVVLDKLSHFNGTGSGQLPITIHRNLPIITEHALGKSDSDALLLDFIRGTSHEERIGILVMKGFLAERKFSQGGHGCIIDQITAQA